MTRPLLLAFTLALIPMSAQAIDPAINRYDIDGMQCADIQAIVERDGAAILRHTSERSNVTLYDRYVRNNDLLCQSFEYPDRTYLPSADDPSCPVFHCKHNEIEFPRDNR